jgi:hypothetical protein
MHGPTDVYSELTVHCHLFVSDISLKWSRQMFEL